MSPQVCPSRSTHTQCFGFKAVFNGSGEGRKALLAAKLKLWTRPGVYLHMRKRYLVIPLYSPVTMRHSTWDVTEAYTSSCKTPSRIQPRKSTSRAPLKLQEVITDRLLGECSGNRTMQCNIWALRMGKVCVVSYTFVPLIRLTDVDEGLSNHDHVQTRMECN